MDVHSDVLKAISSNSYTCSICKRKIYPIIDDVDFSNGTISLSNDMCDFRGGVGDKIIIDKVCPECAKIFRGDMFKSFYKNESYEPDSHNYNPWVSTRGLGKTKVTMTQYIISSHISYEEKVKWLKKIWGNSNDD